MPELFRSGSFHLKRYTNVLLPLPLQPEYTTKNKMMMMMMMMMMLMVTNVADF